MKPKRMSEAEFAKAEPWYALKYAQERLTAAQFAEFAKAEPWYALKYAQERLGKVGRC